MPPQLDRTSLLLWYFMAKSELCLENNNEDQKNREYPNRINTTKLLPKPRKTIIAAIIAKNHFFQTNFKTFQNQSLMKSILLTK